MTDSIEGMQQRIRELERAVDLLWRYTPKDGWSERDYEAVDRITFNILERRDYEQDPV